MLGYYEGQPFAPFLALRRLVLLAGAAAALVELIQYAGEFTLIWPEFKTIFRNGFPSLVDGLGISAGVLGFLSSVGAALGCLLLIRSPRAKTFTLVAEAILILSAGSALVPQLWSYWAMRIPSAAPHLFTMLALPLICEFFRQSLFPVLIIVVLTRKDMHESARP